MPTDQHGSKSGVIRNPSGILPESRTQAAATPAPRSSRRRRVPARLAPRHFLAIPDFSRAELDALFELAERMRGGEYGRTPLAGKTLAMIFMKASTRTRVSFEVGTFQLGGHALFL